MDRVHVAIVGGGVVGLAVASAVARQDRDVFIFEKNRSFGQETSSRNSEVIHSGIYYPEKSLKARTCTEGNAELYRICRQGGIPHKRTGKLIVAADGSETGALETLFEQGLKNGLEGMRMLTSSEVSEMEPQVRAVQAIFLPMTGIIDSHLLMEYYLGQARARGADIVYDAEVVRVDRRPSGYEVEFQNGSGEVCKFEAKVVVNCAGLNSDTVAEAAGIRNEEYHLFYCKGDYFRLGNGKNRLIGRPIYPVCRPDDPSLGIHVTPDLAGGVRLGPDIEYLGSRDTDYSVDLGKRDSFCESVRAFLPFIQRDDLSVDTSGIRPKLQGPGDGFRDFVVRHESDAGYEGFIDLIGIESPGLTASPAIARIVEELVDEIR